MEPTRALHEAGQSLWLDNITPSLLDGGTPQRYIDGCSITGLTSNPGGESFDQSWASLARIAGKQQTALVGCG
ncbi:MAG: hypothetical protein ACRDZ6_04155 [Acidimicrobiales bacterium]